MCCCGCRAGAIVLEAGERVGVAEVGILATVGAVQLPVHRRPKVAVLSTGGGESMDMSLVSVVCCSPGV
jgi:molybdopterin biosynthesis enzyme